MMTSPLREMWMRLPASVRWGIALFLAARLFWWVWGGLVMTALPLPPPPRSWTIPVVSPVTGPLGWLLEPWNRWDVYWYTRIATQGYGIADGRSAFGPLLPMLMNLLSGVFGGQPLIAASLVSDLACLGSLILLFEIAQRDGHAGRRTILMLLTFPVAFFLFVPYTESLLLLLSLGAFLAARSGRWWLSAVCGALAVLTKITALVLLVPLIAELWSSRRSRSVWNGVWLIALPLTAMGWIVVRQLTLSPHGLNFDGPYGLLTPFVSQDFSVEWSTAIVTWPWNSLVSAVTAPIRLWPNIDAIIAIVDLLIALVVVYLIGLAVRLRRPSYTLYVLAVFAMNLMLVVQSTPLVDAPRRWMMAFPLFIAAAAYVPRAWERRWLVFAVLLQLVLTVLFIKWIMVG